MKKQPVSWIGKLRICLRSELSIDKLRHVIDKYGVDTVSLRGGYLVDYLNSMTPEQIDVVLEFKPNFFLSGYAYCPPLYLESSVYLMQKILEHDVDYKYNTHCYERNFEIYKNLYECLKERDDKLYPERQIMTLVSNHMNKWISLFDMMKPHLEESNKKRRFH